MEDVQTALTSPIQDTQAQIGKLAPQTTVVTGDHFGYGDKKIEKDNEAYYEANKYYMEQGAVVPGVSQVVAGLTDLGRGIGRDFTNGGNIAVDIIHTLQRAADAGDEDASWDATRKEAFINANRKDIAPGQEWRYYSTLNPLGAQMLLTDSKVQRRSLEISAQLTGLSGFAAPLVAGIVDIDTPLTLFSGGLSAGAKAGIQASRAGRALHGGVSGAAMGVALGSVDYVFNPNMDAMDVAMFGIMGGGLGLTGGAVMGRNLTQTVHEDMLEELGNIYSNKNVRDMESTGHAPFAKPEPEPVWEGAVVGRPKDEPAVKDPLEGTPERAEQAIEAGDVIGAGSTAGAMQALPTGSATRNMPAGDSKMIVGQAEGEVKKIGSIDDELYNPSWNTSNKVTDFLGKAAYYFSKGIQAIGIGSDWGKVMRSESAVERVMGYHLFESPNGIANNNRSAAVLAESFRKEMIRNVDGYMQGLKEYGAQVGISPIWDRFTQKGRDATTRFNEEVITELMRRRHGGGSPSTNASVIKAADSIDKFYQFDIEVGQGRGGAKGIEAYDGMQSTPGYVPQRWNGANMVAMVEEAMRTGGKKAADTLRRKFIQAIEENYMKLHPTMKPDLTRAAATAVVDRAMITRRGLGRDMLGLLNGDEADFIKAGMLRQGVSEKDIDSMIQSLIGSRDAKMRPGHTQERIDVDFREVSSNGIRMMDLLDTDLFTGMHQRAARTSGLTALASKGWRSKVEFEAWVKAAEDEKKARGISKNTGLKGLSDSFNETGPDFWNGVYSYFNGTPAVGGVSPVYSMITKTTRLAFMNQLGLTSAAEFGAIAGAIGIRDFARHAGAQFRDAITNNKSPLHQELQHLGIMVPDHNVFRSDMMFELEKGNPRSDLMRRADLFLNQASRVQGFLSGFFHVTEAQHKLAQTATISKVFEGILRKDEQFSAARLKSMGFEPAVWEKYVNNGVVEFNKEGRLVRLNTDKWDYNDVELLRTSSTRVSNQLIQKAMIGESNTIFHKDGVAQLIWQFKSFPLLAMEKQFNRNLRMADAGLINTFMWGVVMASAAYAVKQTINGNTQNLTFEKIARGGINMSNLTGWMPMWVDPVGSALGIDSMNMSGYSSRGGPSVIAVPAAMSALDNITKVPGAAFRMLTPGVEYTNADVRTMQAGTGIGQMYGISWLLNTMKHPPKRRKKEEVVNQNADPEQDPQDALPVAKAKTAAEKALARTNKAHETGNYNYRDIMIAAGLDPDNP